MRNRRFKIFVSDYRCTIEDWERAQAAPKSELPKLTGEDKEIARRFKIAQEEYARGELAGLFGQERMKAKARSLGEEVQKILERIGNGHRVVAVVSQMLKGRWILAIQTPKRRTNIVVPRELADDVVDWGLREEVEKLKGRILYALRCEELSVKPQW